ncbi:MAG: S8/S53 family peptidase [Planctomycetota bacterium]
MFKKSSYNWSIQSFVFLMLLASIVAADINDKIAKLDIDTASLDDVIRIFGKPEEYLWGRKTFTKDNLPTTYIAAYPNGFRVVMSGGLISELRHEGPDGYVFRGKFGIGSSLDEVLEVLGEPIETIVGQANQFKEGVLYKDIDGRKGSCYYGRTDQAVRMFFKNYKVSALYVTRSDYSTGGGSHQTVQAMTSVKEFDDVRWKDLSKLDLSTRRGLIATLWFNQKTVWPEQAKMPPRSEPHKILTAAMNPGLGVRKLHEQGITGKGVNVAIIDQPTYLVHPEFAGKIVAYHDTGCETDESSMHGPAVASLLVGTNCGTAPDARVYYAAAPSWKRDTAYEASALDWIINQNKKLPASEKIRVVSVSAAPSSPNVRDKNQHMWDSACRRAEADGIMVLDCTNSHRGFIGRCWYNARVPESPAQCNPWAPPNREFRFNPDEISILVPSSPRTTAEDGDVPGYQYCGKGGLSWAIPYCAGVLAMGWQVNAELSPEQMRELLYKSAFTKKNGAKIINPKKFISLVKNAKVVSKTGGRSR